MGKIYESYEELEEAREKEFRDKVEEIAYYQGEQERTTLDGEWTESELKDDLYDIALEILNGKKGEKGWIEEHKYSAIKDKDLLHPEFIVNDIVDRLDIVQVYNIAYDQHRNDKPRLFGIHYYDQLARNEIKQMLNNNLVK